MHLVIYVHPPQPLSHWDEIASVAAYIYKFKPDSYEIRFIKIEEAKTKTLLDNEIMIDVGCKYDGVKHFDHHQKGKEGECAFSLITKEFEELNFIRTLPLYERIVAEDLKGFKVTSDISDPMSPVFRTHFSKGGDAAKMVVNILSTFFDTQQKLFKDKKDRIEMLHIESIIVPTCVGKILVVKAIYKEDQNLGVRQVSKEDNCVGYDNFIDDRYHRCMTFTGAGKNQKREEVKEVMDKIGIEYFTIKDDSIRYSTSDYKLLFGVLTL